MTTKLVCLLMTVMVIGFTTACSKQGKKPIVEENLVGTWQWVRTDGGIAFHIHETPASTGKNIDLIINSDGKYFIYTNGNLTSDGTYALETRKCIHDHAIKTFINFSSDLDLMVEIIDEESLEVSDEAHDGLASSYKRKY